MDWVDRINRYFLDTIAQRRVRGYSSSNPALVPLSPALIDQLTSLHLASHAGFIGETWVLWGALVDGTPTAIGETDPGWQAMRIALEQSGRLHLVLHEAELRLVADSRRQPICLIGDAKSQASGGVQETVPPSANPGSRLEGP